MDTSLAPGAGESEESCRRRGGLPLPSPGSLLISSTTFYCHPLGDSTTQDNIRRPLPLPPPIYTPACPWKTPDRVA